MSTQPQSLIIGSHANNYKLSNTTDNILAAVHQPFLYHHQCPSHSALTNPTTPPQTPPPPLPQKHIFTHKYKTKKKCVHVLLYRVCCYVVVTFCGCIVFLFYFRCNCEKKEKKEKRLGLFYVERLLCGRVDLVQMWNCRHVDLSLCGIVVMWNCRYVELSSCGIVAMWNCRYVELSSDVLSTEVLCDIMNQRHIKVVLFHFSS